MDADTHKYAHTHYNTHTTTTYQPVYGPEKKTLENELSV